MELVQPADARDLGCVFKTQPTSSSNLDAPRSLRVQLTQPRRARHHIGRTSRRKQALTTRSDHRLKRRIEIGHLIECPVERNLKRPSSFDKAAHARNIDAAIGSQHTRSDADDPKVPETFKRIEHRSKLILGIEEVAGTRTDHRMDRRAHTHGRGHKFIRRSQPTDLKLRTKLDAIRAAGLGSHTRGKALSAQLKDDLSQRADREEWLR